MPVPNQLTACASATRQGVYYPEVHVYNSEPHEKYGLLCNSYFFKGATRDRKKALATARKHIKNMEAMSLEERADYLLTNARRAR